MKKIVMILILTASASVSVFSEIHWFNDYLTAKNAALIENKNLYVLITAPSWCGWCQKLEQQVLKNKDFQDYISDNFIAVYLKDMINGQPNAQLEQFDFGGYPTEMVYSPTGYLISSGIYSEAGLDPDATMDILRMMEDYGLYREDAAHSYINGDSWLNRNGDGSWMDSEGNLFKTLFADSDWLYIYCEEDLDLLLSLPYRDDWNVEMTSFFDWLMEVEDWSVIDGLRAAN